MTTFTAEQLDAYLAYEEIRLCGAYNMFSAEAREATGLDKAQYTFVMKNFAELKKACA